MVLCAAVATTALTGVFASQAGATHFRGANLSWNESAPNQGSFNLTFAARRCGYPGTAPDGCPAIGDVITEFIGGTVFNFGDGNTQGSTMQLRVIAINQADDWLVGQALHQPGQTTPIVHDYSGPGPWNAGFESCCTLSSLNNSPDSVYGNHVNVNFDTANSSPKTSVPPIVDVGANGVQTFTVPATAPPAPCSTLRWRLATPAEASHDNPPGLAINANNGAVTWDTTGRPLGLYIAAVVVEALDGSGAVCSNTMVNFILRVTDNPNRPPEWVAPTPADQTEFTVNEGDNLTVNLAADDPDTGDTVNIGHTGLPVGSTLNTTPGDPATGTFSWTPGAGTAGDYLVTFTAQDGQNPPGSALPRTIVIHVVSAPVQRDTVITAHPALVEAAPGLKVRLYVSATLKATNPTEFLGGKTIKFTTRKGKLICTDVTDAGGYASCNGLHQLVDVTFSAGYFAIFAGDAQYESAIDRGHLIRVGNLEI